MAGSFYCMSISPLLVFIRALVGSAARWSVLASLLLLFPPSVSAAESAPAAPLAAERRVVLEVNGLEDELRDNVRHHLSLFGVESSGGRVSRRGLKRFLRPARDEAQAALQAFGYYSPVINHTVSVEDEAFRVVFEVQPGTVSRFRTVDVTLHGEGADEPALLALMQKQALQPGEPVLHERYAALKSALQKRAYDLGYLDSAFLENTLRVFPDEYAADVVLKLETGQRYYFGDITLDQDILDPDYMRRFIRQSPGDPFLSDELLALQQALSASGYFSHVSLDVAPEAADGQVVPVRVQTAPRKAARYGASIGYGTDTGARVGLSTEFRRVNRLGHRFASKVQFSEVSASLASRYTIPVGDVRHESLDFTANAEREKLNDTESEEYRLAGTLNQLRWGGRRRLSLGLVHEDWQFGDGPSTDATLLIPAIEFTLKNADDPFYALRGYSYTVQVRGAAEGVLSDVDFLQATVFGRAVLPLGERSRLLGRFEYGTTVTDAFDNLPPSLRYFAGGAQSVRGYGYKDLSPLDEQGNRIGGKYFAALGVEVDYLISENSGIAAFVDAGDATRDPIDTLKLGAGVGYRYRSPVGMFRVDLAHPFDDPDNNVRVHLSFGADL